MSDASAAEIGVLGGSGFYSLLSDAKDFTVETPYGPPSAPVSLGAVGGRQVAFIPRHGAGHTLPPHMINYRANLWALKSLGVTGVLSACAAGSLQQHIRPGEIVVCEQLVNWTSGRQDTYFDGPNTTHISLADPYCPVLSHAAIVAGKTQGFEMHPAGTMVVIGGPRFSTRAESEFFSAQGWSAITMTQYPEAALARELEMCFAGIALITDYDAGVKAVSGDEGDSPGVPPVSAAQAIEVFKQNTERLRSLLLTAAPEISPSRDCECNSALSNAAVNSDPTK